MEETESEQVCSLKTLNSFYSFKFVFEHFYTFIHLFVFTYKLINQQILMNKHDPLILIRRLFSPQRQQFRTTNL